MIRCSVADTEARLVIPDRTYYCHVRKVAGFTWIGIYRQSHSIAMQIGSIVTMGILVYYLLFKQAICG